jgi:uncharacterized membrane protein
MSKPSTFSIGGTVFGIGCLGLGALTIYYRDFAEQWQAMPAKVPFPGALVWLSAGLLLVCAVGLAIPSLKGMAARLLTLNFAVLWVLPHLFGLLPSLLNFGVWLGLCEALGAFSGAVVLAQYFAPDERNLLRTKAAIAAFGACCLVYGASHLVYADFTAAMIPGFLPWHRFLAFATGGVHILAGFALLFGIYPKIAASVEAVMMSCFVLLLHVPSVVLAPVPAWAADTRTALTALFWATALTAAAWSIAQYLFAPAEK